MSTTPAICWTGARGRGSGRSPGRPEVRGASSEPPGASRAPGRAQGPTAGPRLAAQRLVELPSSPPSRPCPAAGRSGRLPSSRPCEAKCLDHPASSRSPAGPLLFSFGGARAGPGRRRRALGAACPAHVLRPARWLDSGASFPGEHGGPAGAGGSAGSGGGSSSSSVPTRRCTSCWGAGGPCSPSARGSGRARVPHSPWGLRRPGGPPPGVRELSLEAVRGTFSSSLGTRLRVLCLLLPLFSLSGGARPHFLGGRGCLLRKVRGHFPPGQPPWHCWFNTEAPALGRAGEQPGALSVQRLLRWGAGPPGPGRRGLGCRGGWEGQAHSWGAGAWGKQSWR